MSVNWKQVPAFAMAQQQAQEMIKRLLAAESIEEKEAYMADYLQKPEDMQCALGYMRCLIESSFAEAYSVYGRYCMEGFERRRVPPMRLPLRFIGWAGPHNDIGPAYEIDSACLSGADSRIFYTDDDIQYRPESTEWLAEAVAQQSSGIVDLRSEMLQSLDTIEGPETGMISGVSFRLSKAASRKITVNQQEMECGEHSGAIFVLPKAGEFTCMLGEMLDGDPTACVILAKHMYCMK